MEVIARECADCVIVHAQAIAGLAKSLDEDATVRPRPEGHIHPGRGTVPYLPLRNPINTIRCIHADPELVTPIQGSNDHRHVLSLQAPWSLRLQHLPKSCNSSSNCGSLQP